MKYLFKERFKEFQKTLLENTVIKNLESVEFSIEEGLIEIYKILINIKQNNRNLYIIGNGGSAAIASHSVTDFLNVAKISAHTINDAAVLTCMANDYGYEDAFSRVLNTTIKKEDLLIAISSSGNSKNIINSVKTAKKLGAKVVTLSGFSSKNNLRVLGDVNIWSNSKDYGMVEVAHQFILHNLSDRFIDNS